MTYSIYEEIVELQTKGATQKEVRTKLIDIGIYSIFSWVYDMYHEEKGLFSKIVFFVAHAYSYESKKIIIGQDWIRCQQNIAKEIDLPGDILDELIKLKEMELAHCVQRFMNLYKDNVDFVHVQHLKAMYSRIIEVGTKFEADDEGNAELEENFKNIERAEKLLKKITDHEEKMKRKYKLLTVPAEQLAKTLPSNFHIDSLNVEHSSFIKRSN